MMLFFKFIRLFVVGLMFAAIASQAQQTTAGQGAASINKISDLTYAQMGAQELKLDLYMPANTVNAPLLVYVHGGAWSGGSKENPPTDNFVEAGYAVASVDFRLSGTAKFPAQIYDIKAAIRYLRGNAKKYGYNATKVGILGTSSGGHLVAVMAVSNGSAQMEGRIGDYLDQSSDVQAVVSYFGASNLTTILNQSTPRGLRVRVPALDLLLGGQPEEQVELARLASPVFHVNDNAAPLLMLHGDQDPQMPINQSHELYFAYQEQDKEVQLVVVHGAEHGGPLFTNEQNNAIVKEFLDRHLR